MEYFFESDYGSTTESGSDTCTITQATLDRWDDILQINKVTIPIMLTLYFSIFVLSGHNVVRFMIRGKQLRSYQLASFYSFIGIIVILRSY